MMRNNSTPVAYLSLGELLAKIEETTEAVVRRALASKPSDIERGNYVYGINGLAKLLGCSKTSACRIKASGMLDEAITQIGAIIIIDADKALALAKAADKHRRQGQAKQRSKITNPQKTQAI